jgi:hypothetical protein
MAANILKFGEDWNESILQVNDRGEITNDRGEVLMSHEHVIGVNINIVSIKAMNPPKDVPALKATGNLGAIPQNAIANHLDKCKEDVKNWDPIRTSMTKLANSLRGFCSDSITALEEMVSVSQALKDFDSMSEKERNDIRDDLQGIFNDLLAQAKKNEKNAGNLAADLGKFGGLISGDKIATDNLRIRYEDYIKDQEQKIRNFELSKGMQPTDDLLNDIQQKIKTLQEEIAELEKDWIITTSVAGGSVALLSNPFTLLFGLAGCIGSGAAAGVFKDKWDKKLEELKPFIDELKRAERLISLKSWFNSNLMFFKDLASALENVTSHVNSLRGAWQEIANELETLIGDTGKLNAVKAATEDWQKPIASFKAKTTKKVYERIQDLASYFQKVAYIDQAKKAA